jgi:hypothetical protein
MDTLSTEPMNTRSLLKSAEKPDVGFVACIEGGVLEAQALLLFESIRRYTGSFKDSAIYALSPRTGHAISSYARKRLEQLEVQYIDTILNTECREYGSANRVAAAAHIEETQQHTILVILDSDTLFLREPSEFILTPDIDVAVRPVDVKGICSSGPTDACNAYWDKLCRLCGVDYDQLPWSNAFVDNERIKASYNGGLVVVRGGLRIMSRWADFFFASIREGLYPRSDMSGFRAGAGWIEPAVARLWGSNQAALSLAIWSTTRKVRELPPTYNYPLHQHDKIDPSIVTAVFSQLVHVHYHWLFAEDSLSTNPLFLPSGPLSDEQRDWLRSVTPIRSVHTNPIESSNTIHTTPSWKLVTTCRKTIDKLLPDSTRRRRAYNLMIDYLKNRFRVKTPIHCSNFSTCADEEKKK